MLLLLLGDHPPALARVSRHLVGGWEAFRRRVPDGSHDLIVQEEIHRWILVMKVCRFGCLNVTEYGVPARML